MLRHTIAATVLCLALATAPAAAQSNDPPGYEWTNPDAAVGASQHEITGRGIGIGVKAIDALLTTFGEAPRAACNATALVTAAQLALDVTRLALETQALPHVQTAANAVLDVADTAAGHDPYSDLCIQVARPLYGLIQTYLTDPRVSAQRQRAANGLAALDAQR